MTNEEITKKAYEAYPKYLDIEFNTEEYDINNPKREGYIKALTEIESIPKIHGWVARDEDGTLAIHHDLPHRRCDSYWTDGETADVIDEHYYPELTWADEPVEVELMIRKI